MCVADEKYKGADSLKLLAKVGSLINEKGYKVCNIDSTIILVVFVMVGLLTACGGKKMADDGMMMENAVGKTENYGESSEISDTVSTADKTTNVRDNRKIIEKIQLSIETKEFDVLLESLDSQIATLNGYVESSDIYGREFDSYENVAGEQFISGEQYLRIAKLTAILRVANGLDRSHKQKFKNIKASVKDKEFIITVHTDKDITLEKGLLKERANFFEEVFFLKPVIMQQKGR